MKPNSGVESHWTLIAVSYLLLTDLTERVRPVMMNSEEKAGQSYDTFQMGHIHYTWELGRPYIGEIIEDHLLAT